MEPGTQAQICLMISGNRKARLHRFMEIKAQPGEMKNRKARLSQVRCPSDGAWDPSSDLSDDIGSLGPTYFFSLLACPVPCLRGPRTPRLPWLCRGAFPSREFLLSCPASFYAITCLCSSRVSNTAISVSRSLMSWALPSSSPPPPPGQTK